MQPETSEVADDSHPAAGLPALSPMADHRCATAGRVLGRWLGQQMAEAAWPGYDSSLLRYADVVGTHRWPGSHCPPAASVGPTPIALWSDVVVSHAVAEALGIPLGAAEKGERAYETDGCGVACG